MWNNKKILKKLSKNAENMTNTTFFIVGKHPVIEALKNPQWKVLRLFLTEESKKNIHRISPKRNLLKHVKVFFKTKKELDKYCKNEQILHQGYVAEIEKLEEKNLKEFINIKWCSASNYWSYISRISYFI